MASPYRNEDIYAMHVPIDRANYPNDTTPRFPVKKTQITTYKDINTNQPVDLKDPSNIKTTVEYDPNTRCYIYKTYIGDQVISTPFSLTSDEYLDHTRRQMMSNYFKERNAALSIDGKDKKNDFALKDINFDMPTGGHIFGPGGVKIKANGYIELSTGVKHSSIDNPTLSQRARSRTAFDFNEDIQMNVSATVGNKINFDMNYDTKALFDFDSKKLKLAYDPSLPQFGGDEDGIIKSIEAGNVSMNTTNSLINGGTSLFGIRAELQFGKLRVNTVVSQQESQTRSVNSQGNIQTTSFEFKADAYDENRHFFLNHYFRDNYDNAMSKLPFVQSPISIKRIEVWITNNKGDFTQSRNFVAFADMAEHNVIKNPRWVAQGSVNAPYNNANNLYSTITTTYPAIRDISQVTGILNGVLEGGLDYEKVEKARLLSSTDYTFNAQLGYISLNTTLQPDQVLAVAYEYTMNGNTYQVGEFASDIVDKYDASNNKSGALFLRLLKPVSLSPRAYTWDLMMKNVYSLGATGIQKDRFRFNISFQADTLGTYISYLPEGAIKDEMLLRVMNLDRLDARENTNPDGIFDYLEGYTVQSQNGRVYFPVVEPFGSHLAKKINNSTIASKYIYQELYDSTKTIAQQIAEKNKFKMSGSYRGNTSQSDISLNATNVAQGSVRVTAAGVTLTEGVDYIVDYSSGNVTIINQSLIDTNTPIQVSLEDRALSMQRKTLLGLNLSYDISKNFNVGATIMHLSEKPLTTKTVIGEESVKNTLWGLNTSYKTQSLWLTNMIDKLPFVEATQPSQISFTGEFAHMIAGHYQDERSGGYSYLDDFENAESKLDIKNPYGWALSATPYDNSGSALFPEASLTNNINYGINRAQLAWFMIDGIFTRKNSSSTPLHLRNDKDQLSNHFVREIYLREIYPNKDISNTTSSTIPVLNLSYYPNERGPYNLDAANINSDGKLLNPEKRWAGITRKMDVRDFEASNIEYIEFWLMDPFVYNNTASVPNDGGDLYFNLGEISEDVLKDGKKFYENGLPIDDDPSAYETTVWGRVPTRQSTVYAFDNTTSESRRKQDVGLNGLSTQDEYKFTTYADYLTAYRANLSPTALAEQNANPSSPLNDPSGDSYKFYRSSYYDQNETGILDRYKYYNGTEGNSPSSNDTDENYSTAARSTPDVEDIDQDYTLNENEAYFQYKVELKPGKMNVGSNYIVDSREVTVPLRNGTDGKVTWYQFKVPVRQYDKRVGNIQDFKSIRFMRMFLTNFKQATFLRFGTLQLVRGEWRIYEPTLNANDVPSGNGTIAVSTVNIEENGNRKPVNYIMPPGVSRALDAGQSQLLQENEQSLSMRIDGLDASDARAIYKNTFYDLRRYKRLQLFTHLEEIIGETPLNKGDFTVFLRLGTDYKNNYYEYEIPLSVTPPPSTGQYNPNSPSDRYIVWPKDNTFDFSLELLKNVKLNRNKEKRKNGSVISFTSLYSEYDPDNLNNKVSVIGNPSLAEVNIIMIGVRNNTTSSKSGIVWVNELRLTDFDEKGGWAAQGNLNVALSDIGTINISGRKETVGFGTLDQRLQERRSDDYSLYNIATSLDLGRFIPEKAKISIPFYYSYSNQTTTPEYDPFDKDVKLDESINSVSSRAEKDSIKSLAQEKTTIKNISFNNVKVNIQSETPMPYDPANFSFSYSSSITENKDPSTIYDQIKDYKASMTYSYSPIMKTWEPFKNVKGNKGSAKFAKSIGFNYLPSNIGFNSALTRYYTETLTRDIENYVVGGTNTSTQFLSWSQAFYWDRDFNLTWDFTKNLKFSIQTGTKAEIEEPYMQVNKKLNRDKYDEWKDAVLRSIRSLGSPLEYRQTSSITYQLPFRNIPATDWINSSIGYNSGYQWNRGAQVENIEIGNTINNTATFDFKNQWNLVTLYNKSEFLRKVNQRFDSKNRPNQQGRTRVQREPAKPKKRNFSKKVNLNTDSATTISHALDTKKITVTAKRTDGSKYAVKFKKIDNNTIRINNKDTAQIQLIVLADVEKDSNPFWQDLKEYSARGLMSLRTIQFNYSHRNETNISGFRPMVGDAFGQKNSEYGLTPGLGFAFGFDGGDDFIRKSLDRDWLVKNMENITPAIYNNADKFELRAQIVPFKGFTIELNANREKNRRTEIQYMYDGMPRTYGGSFSMTTIALSTALHSSKASNNYHSDAFDKFIEYRNIIRNRLENKYKQTYYPSGGFISTDNPTLVGQQYSTSNGAVDPNSGDVLVPAFIAAYTGKSADKISLSAFPSLLSMLPNWTMTYDGLSNIPWIKSRFKSIRLTHAYSCFYQVNNYSSFSSWVGTGDDLGFIRDVLSGKPTPSSPYSFSSVSIAEMFNPLIGLDGAMNNNMTINAQFNNYRTLNLSLASYQIIESIQKEIIVGFGYRINEFNRIIGLTPKKNNFNNDLNLKADISHKTNQALLRSIEENFTQATSGTTTVTLRLTADYTLSRALTLQAFFDRVLNEPLITSTSYPTTNSNFGVSIRFTLVQ